MEVIKKKVAVDSLETMNIQAFVYQSGHEVEVEDYPEGYKGEQIFNDAQQNRFKVVNGVVVKKTEEELKNQPRYTEYLAECRKERYKNETDSLKEDVIEFLAKKLPNEPMIKEWLDGKDKIREEVK